MALQLEIDITQNKSTGDELLFEDVTPDYDANTNPGGYGSANIKRSDVNYTRLIFGDFISESNRNTSVDDGSKKLYREYKALQPPKISGDKNGADINVDDIFINVYDIAYSQFDCEETGRYAYFNTSPYLPSNSNPLTIQPSDLIFDNIFEDRVFSVEYEIFTTGTASGNISEGEVYVVKPNNTSAYDATNYEPLIEYNGVKYSAFQTFTGVSGVTNYTLLNSLGMPHKRHTSVKRYFVLTYNSYQNRNEVITKFAKHGYNEREKWLDQVTDLDTMTEAIEFSVTPNYLNVQGATDLINYVARRSDYLKKCL